MSFKLKAVVLSILAAMGIGTFTVINATAETGGHFVSETAHTTIVGTENSTHFTKLVVGGLTPIRCTSTSYAGTITAATVTQITLSPSFANCETDGTGVPSVTIHMNGCDYLFKIGKKSEGDNTQELVCPAGKVVDITHEGCTIQIPPQTSGFGIAYTTKNENGGKHSLTVDKTSKGETAHFESGFCILLGTKQAVESNGSFTLSAYNTDLSPVGFTATGSQG